MPITTDDGKLAVMEWDQDWEPGFPLAPASLGQAERQHLLWGFPEVLWGEYTPHVATLVFATLIVSPAVLGVLSVNSEVDSTGS